MMLIEAQLKQFSQAVGRLEEALQDRGTMKDRDSAILRFIITFDTAWKSLKSHLEDKTKIRCASPKMCIREAYNVGIIEFENQWIDIIDDRNDITHLYLEEVAEELYEKLPKYLKLFQDLLQQLPKTE